jgi:hypothetical protein
MEPHIQGYYAYHTGKNADQNPHKSGLDSRYWDIGYFAAGVDRVVSKPYYSGELKTQMFSMWLKAINSIKFLLKERKQRTIRVLNMSITAFDDLVWVEIRIKGEMVEFNVGGNSNWDVNTVEAVDILEEIEKENYEVI